MSPKEVDAVVKEFFKWEDVQHFRAGTIAATAWNAARATKKRKTWTSWRDFFNPFTPENKSRGLTHAEMLEQARRMVASTHSR